MHSRTHRHDSRQRRPRSSDDTVKRSEQARRNLALVTGGFGAFFRHGHGHGHHGHGGGHCGGGQPPAGQPAAPAAPGAAAPGATASTPTPSTS